MGAVEGGPVPVASAFGSRSEAEPRERSGTGRLMTALLDVGAGADERKPRRRGPVQPLTTRNEPVRSCEYSESMTWTRLRPPFLAA